MRLDPETTRRVLEMAGVAPRTDSPVADVSEKDFQAEVIKLAKRNGWLAYHVHDSRKSEAGFWDTTLIRGPVLIGAELKVGSNQPIGPQLTWLEALADVQVVQSAVWRPEDWSAIEDCLRGAGPALRTVVVPGLVASSAEANSNARGNQ
jgi:hypothetical protein